MAKVNTMNNINSQKECKELMVKVINRTHKMLSYVIRLTLLFTVITSKHVSKHICIVYIQLHCACGLYGNDLHVHT